MTKDEFLRILYESIAEKFSGISYYQDDKIVIQLIGNEFFYIYIEKIISPQKSIEE